MVRSPQPDGRGSPTLVAAGHPLGCWVNQAVFMFLVMLGVVSLAVVVGLIWLLLEGWGRPY
jgi:hypothetical protein